MDCQLPCPENSQNSETNSIEEVAISFKRLQSQRKKRLSALQEAMNEKVNGKQRKPQNKVVYILFLLFTITLSLLNASVFLVQGSAELKGIIITVFIYGGFILSLISSRIITSSWLEVAKLYFLIDSVVPAMISGSIAFSSFIKFSGIDFWYDKTSVVGFPLWAFYFGGALRVMTAHGNLSKWEVISYKLTTLFCGLVFFYIGYEYMTGGYKVTNGFLVQLESKIKDMTYLYVFGMVEVCFSYYRRLSYFDQTEELKSAYQFMDIAVKNDELIVEAEYENIKQESLQQELSDMIVSKQFSNGYQHQNKDNKLNINISPPQQKHMSIYPSSQQ